MEIYHQFCPWRNPAKKYSTVSAANPLSHPERQKNIFAFPKSSWRQTSALLAEINEALFFRIRVYTRNGKQLSWKVLIQSDWFKKKKRKCSCKTQTKGADGGVGVSHTNVKVSCFCQPELNFYPEGSATWKNRFLFIKNIYTVSWWKLWISPDRLWFKELRF